MSTVRSRGALVGSAAFSILVLCAGCGSGSEAQAPARAAQAFEDAVGAKDGAAACRLLAPETRAEVEQSADAECAEAILEEDLPERGTTESASAFGTMAEVRSTTDTVFLTEFDGQWLVMAAGCAPVPEAPYDCAIQGG